MKCIIEVRRFDIKKKTNMVVKYGCVNVEVHVTTTVLNFT